MASRNDWSDYFASSFNTAFETSSKNAFEKWKTKETAENLKSIYVIGPDGTPMMVGQVPKGSQVMPTSSLETPEAKTQREQTAKSQEAFSGYTGDALSVLGALDKLEDYAKQLPKTESGILNQATAKVKFGVGSFAADPKFSQYDAILSGELVPLARKLQEEKGPITEFDVQRVERGLGQKTLPFEQKKLIIQESRNKVAEQVYNKLNNSGISIDEFKKKHTPLYNKVRRGNLKFTIGDQSYSIPFDEVEEFKKEMGL